MFSSRFLQILAIVWWALCYSPVIALSEEPIPKQLQSVTIRERLGTFLNQNLVFRNHEDKEISLGSFFNKQKPVVLTLNYFTCENLCNIQLNALLGGLRDLKLLPGKDYDLISVSIDSRNTPELAAHKRKMYLNALALGPDAQWDFLTGEEPAIRSLASDVGFEYKYDAKTDQFAHSAAVYFISPAGKITRYLYGLEYPARNIKFALIDASEGKVGSSVEKLILSCFHYDDVLGKYSPFAFGMMRVAGVITVVTIGIWLSFMWRRESKYRRRENL